MVSPQWIDARSLSSDVTNRCAQPIMAIFGYLTLGCGNTTLRRAADPCWLRRPRQFRPVTLHISSTVSHVEDETTGLMLGFFDNERDKPINRGMFCGCFVDRIVYDLLAGKRARVFGLASRSKTSCNKFVRVYKPSTVTSDDRSLVRARGRRMRWR